MRGIRRIRRQPLTEHRCPGACGQLIPVGWFACVRCWDRLPGPIRARVVVTQRPGASAIARAAVHAAAAQWYLDNPPAVPR